MKFAKYIAILVAGIGLGVISMLVLGYEKQEKKEPVKLIKPVASVSSMPLIPATNESEDLKKANKKLDKKVDRLADSLLSLKARIDSLNAPEDNTEQLSDAHIKLDSFNIQGEDIVVERDQLLTTELVKIVRLDEPVTSDTANPLVDSLKSSLNIQADEVQEYLEIELWKSPLNFEGYKLSKSKLVIYGLINELILEVSLLNDIVYLKTNEGTYELERTGQFKDLRKVKQ